MGCVKTLYEINEEEYNKLIAIENENKKEFHNMIEDIAHKSMFPPNAYGCEIPMDVFKLDDKYYASWYRWSHCN